MKNSFFAIVGLLMFSTMAILVNGCDRCCCPENFDPVWDCDGRMYGNKCEMFVENRCLVQNGQKPVKMAGNC